MGKMVETVAAGGTIEATVERHGVKSYRLRLRDGPKKRDEL
jgi:hypothetical protein